MNPNQGETVKPKLEQILRLEPVAALAMLGKPMTFDLGCLRHLNSEAINAARQAGMATVMIHAGKLAWRNSYRELVEESIKAHSRKPGELRIESVRHRIDYTYFDIVCTDHPDPVPARKPSDEALEDDKPSEG